MKALVHDGQGHIALKEWPRPQIVLPKDAVVRVTRSTICTSDLHILHGAVPQATPDTVLGHEFVGVVEETGIDVERFKPGDRVAVNCETFCGTCFFCKRGWVNNCVEGGWKLGCSLDGCQAEYVRVPFADNALTHIPDDVSDEDALFLGDILATGWWSAQLGEIEADSTVAVIGAGPVGLTTMMCARLADPGHIVCIEPDSYRRQLAVDRGLADSALDGSESLDALEAKVRELSQGRGADVVVEAAGAATTFKMAWRIARPNANVVLAAMYEQDQVLPLPQMYGKNLVFKTGGVDASGLDEVMALIQAGKLDTSLLISKRFALNDILEAYDYFAARTDHCLKVVITPWEE